MHLAVALMIALAAAPDGDSKRSQELATRSIREYDLGQLDAALHDVEQAYLLNPVPALLFNVGQCQRALEHWKEAERAFRNFLRYRPNAPNRAVVERLIAEMTDKELAAETVPAPAPVATRRQPRPAPSLPTTMPAAPPSATSPPPRRRPPRRSRPGATPCSSASAPAPWSPLACRSGAGRRS